MKKKKEDIKKVVLELSSPSETYVDIHRHTILIVLPALYIELSL